jgi:hypothetical protein
MPSPKFSFWYKGLCVTLWGLAVIVIVYTAYRPVIHTTAVPCDDTYYQQPGVIQ